MNILIVEDDRELADILRRALSEKLYSIVTAHDGETAVHLGLTQEFSLVLLDVMLPKVDGISVCAALRAAGRLVPVIMLTARDRVEDRVLGLDAGADDYLIKPFAMSELFARIRAVRRRAENRPMEILKLGDLSMDPRTNFAQLGARKIPLTAKELSLLQYFLQHPNVVLSRTEILEHVWDANYEGLGNVVDVYVNYLRNKLESGGEPGRIETIRGRGYMLREPSSGP